MKKFLIIDKNIINTRIKLKESNKYFDNFFRKKKKNRFFFRSQERIFERKSNQHKCLA